MSFLESHSIFILNGLDYLKSNKILCDIILIADSTGKLEFDSILFLILKFFSRQKI
jgi:hypothetical protein